MQNDEVELQVTTKYETKITFQKILDTENLATLMSDRDLCMIGELCLKEKEEDEDSRQDWKEVTDEAMDIINPNLLAQKTTPWVGSADVKYPLLCQALVNSSSRMLPALIKRDEPIKPRIVGADPEGTKALKAENVKTYMTWQLMDDPKSKWKRNFDKSLSQLFLCGTIFRKCCYDEVTGKKYFEMIPYKDIVVNKNITSLCKAPRISQRHIFRQNDIETRIRTGKWVEYNYQKSDGMGEDDDSDETNYNADTYNKTYSFTEQHRWLDLDNDGYAEPYIVYIDDAMKKAICINRNFDLEDDDYDQETGEVLELEPNQYYTAYHLIPAFDGSFYSYGFAYLFLHINSVCNSIINMILDSGSLVANGGGFIAKGARNRSGTIRSAMNEWHPLDTTPGTAIKDNIFPFPNNGPPPVLMELLNVLLSSGKELAGMTEVLTGEMPSRELPAQTMMMLVDEVTKPFSAIHGRIYESLKDEFEMLFISNAKSTDNEVYKDVLGLPDADYRNDFDKNIVTVIPGADPNASTQAQQQTKLAVLASIPGVNQYEVSKEQVKSLGYDTERFIPAPQEPSPSLDELQFEFNKKVAEKQLQQKDRELDQRDLELEIKQKELTLEQERNDTNALKAKYYSMLAASQAEAVDKQTTLAELETLVSLDQGREKHAVDTAIKVMGAENERADVNSRRVAAQQSNQAPMPTTPPEIGGTQE